MVSVGGAAPTEQEAANMFTITYRPLTLQKIAKGIYCVGARDIRDRSKTLHYRVFGTRGAYEVGVQYEIGAEPEILGMAGTLAIAEQIINNHYINR